MAERVTLQTAYGKISILADLFHDFHDIFIAAEEHTLTINDEVTAIEAGTPYLHNSELERRTRGRAAFLLVQGGLYDLWRLTTHITHGERAEARHMGIRREDLKACAEAFRVSGALTGQEAAQIQRVLKVIEPDFVEPKRAPRKLLAGDRIIQAQTLGRRSRRDRRRIGPAILVTNAAGRHVQVRLEEAWGINHFFNRRSAHVYVRIMEIMEAVESLWRFVAGTPIADRLDRTDMASGGLPAALAALRRSRRPSDLDMLCALALHHRTTLESIREQPFRKLVEQADARLADIFQLSPYGDRAVVLRGPVDELRRTVRRLRMIHYFELCVISVLAFYLERKKNGERSLSHEPVRRFLSRLDEACAKVESFTAAELDPIVRSGFLAGCATSRSLLGEGSYELAKNVLKDSVRALADPSYGSQSKAA